MPSLNWKYEAGAAACMRFWQERKEHYFQLGLAAPAGARCPYPETSFAAIHWRRGVAARSEPDTDAEVRTAGKAAIARIMETL